MDIDGACVEIADAIDIVGYVESSIASTAFKRGAILLETARLNGFPEFRLLFDFERGYSVALELG